MAVVELDAEHQVRERLLDYTLESKLLFDCHVAVTSRFDGHERPLRRGETACARKL
jgi:hypothetical protein